jgi:hypothetical protein
MPRGKLIYPFLACFRQLDTVATAADPDGASELTTGYDEMFREPVQVLADPADQLGESARVESAEIQIPAQIEPQMFERLEMILGGEAPTSKFAVALHFKYLERNGLVDASGNPTIRKNDRLSRILTIRQQLVEEIKNPPGLFVHQVQSRSFGLGVNRNLCLVIFEDRKQSARSG